MGMSTGGGGATNLQNEINVTPMIDVLLVLLVIFMMAVPMGRKALDVQIPDPTPAPSTTAAASDQIVLQVLPGGAYKINSEDVPKDRLAARIKEIYEGRPNKIIFIKGDPKVTYQDVIHAMDVSRGSGVKVIGLTPQE